MSLWVGVPGLALMALLLLATMTSGDGMWSLMTWGTVISLLFMPGLLYLRDYLAEGFDPNRDHAQREHE